MGRSVSLAALNAPDVSDFGRTPSSSPRVTSISIVTFTLSGPFFATSFTNHSVTCFFTRPRNTSKSSKLCDGVKRTSRKTPLLCCFSRAAHRKFAPPSSVGRRTRASRGCSPRITYRRGLKGFTSLRGGLTRGGCGGPPSRPRCLD